MAELPYCVYASGQADLMRIEEARFRVIRDGGLSSILTGWGYVLVTQAMLDVLRQAGVSPRCRPVIIENPPEAQVTSYQEIAVGAEVTPETIDAAADSGEHLWLYAERSLFVSAMLRKRLESASTDLTFSKGFEDFAGR